jgi:hypothetical protein
MVILIMPKFYIQSGKYAGALCWLVVSFFAGNAPRLGSAGQL